MDSFSYAVLFLIGISLGSFLNVITRRYHPEENNRISSYIRGRSHCERCGRTLVWYELIPLVSFLLQRGKCRTCQNKLSLQYPLVELIGGMMSVAIGYFFSVYALAWGVDSSVVWGAILIWICVWLLSGAVLLIDLRWKIIPNSINLFLFILGVMWTGYITLFDVFPLHSGDSFVGKYAGMFPAIEGTILNHSIAALGAAVFFLIVVLVTRGRGMGVGDVKLAGALGMLFGWPDIGLIILFSFIIGMIGVIPLLLFKKKGLSDAIPFGPSLILAAGVIFFFGTVFLEQYFDILYTLLGV